MKNWLDNGLPETTIGVGEKPDPSLGQGPNDWAKLRDKVFARKCQACHSSDKPDGGLDLTDIKQVRARVLAIYNRAIIIGDMPVLGLPTLTRKERTVLSEWINAGMPE